MLLHPFFVFLTVKVRLVNGQSAVFRRRQGFYFTGFPLYSGQFQMQRLPRRSGSPGVNTCLSAHERRVYVPGLW